MESFLSPNMIDEIKSKLAETGYVCVVIHYNGTIDLEYPDYRENRAERKSSAKVYLTRDKEVKVDDIAGKITPQTQKLIKALSNAKLIDNSWKINTHSSMPGEYAPRGTGYHHLSSQMTQKSVQDLATESPLTKISKDIILYHGTSAIDWEQIQKQGALKPLFLGSKAHGFESRAKHEYNKNHIYLAANEDEAWRYAKARAQSMSRKLFPKEWEWNQHQGCAHWPVKPVLLKIHIPDTGKLRTDDDVVNGILTQHSRKIWEEKPEEEKKKLIRAMSRGAKFDTSDVAQQIWRETERGFKEILSKLRPEIYKAYFASLMKSKQVAYDGMIPIKFIQEIPFISRNPD